MPMWNPMIWWWGIIYRANQGEDETIPSFATRIDRLLSWIRDRFSNQLPHQEEQRILKDHLFHGSRKSIRDSVKYCLADASVDYMHFLEECRKSEEEGKAGQAEAASKMKAAAATVPPTKQDELVKQLNHQWHQIHAFVGASKKFSVTHKGCTTLLQCGQDREILLWERGLWEKDPRHRAEGTLGKRASLLSQEPLPSQQFRSLQQEQGATKSYKPYQRWQCEGVGDLKWGCPTLKGIGMFQGGMLKQPSRTEKAFPNWAAQGQHQHWDLVSHRWKGGRGFGREGGTTHWGCLGKISR